MEHRVNAVEKRPTGGTGERDKRYGGRVFGGIFETLTFKSRTGRDYSASRIATTSPTAMRRDGESRQHAFTIFHI